MSKVGQKTALPGETNRNKKLTENSLSGIYERRQKYDKSTTKKRDHTPDSHTPLGTLYRLEGNDREALIKKPGS